MHPSWREKVPVWAVLDYTRTKTIERELCLAKVSILGPEYFEDQLHAKVEQSRLTEAEHVAAEDHAAAHPNGSPSAASTDPSHHLTGAHLSPSEALRQKHFHLQALTTLASQFQGKVVDVSHDCLTIEVSGKTQRIDAFLKLVRPYGILEAARTGVMVMPRAPIESAWRGMADEEAVEEIEAIDAVRSSPISTRAPRSLCGPTAGHATAWLRQIRLGIALILHDLQLRVLEPSLPLAAEPMPVFSGDEAGARLNRTTIEAE